MAENSSSMKRKSASPAGPREEDQCDHDGERPRLPERPESPDLHSIVAGHQHGRSDESDHCNQERRNERKVSPEEFAHRPQDNKGEQQNKDEDQKQQEEHLEDPPPSVPPRRTTALLRPLYLEEQNACSSCSATHHSRTAMKDESTNKEVQQGVEASSMIKEEAEITSEEAKPSRKMIVLPPSDEEEQQGDEKHERGQQKHQQGRMPDATQERRVPRRRNHQFAVIRPGAFHVGGQRVNGDEEDGTARGDTVVGGPSGDTVVFEPAYPGFVVPEPQPPDKKHDLVWRAVILCLLLVSIAGLALGLSFGLSNRTNVEGTSPPAPILTKWVMIGQPDDIAGDMEEAYLGIFVAVSGDGGTIAATSLVYIAQPYIVTFSVTGNSTQPLANKIEAPPATDIFGNGVSLSHNGRLLATGAGGNGNYFYQFGGLLLTQQFWTEQGLISEFGSQPALSMDGSTVAVGGIGVKVYRRYGQLEEQTAWSQVGQALSGEIDTPRDLFGWSKDLSTNGNRLAVGIPGSLNSTGRVRVFDLLEGAHGAAYWNETGNDLVGIRELDAFGFDLSLSEDGSCVAVGATQNFDFHSGGSSFFTTSSRPGYAQVHCLQGNEWVQRGQTLEGSTGVVDAQAGDPRGSWFGYSLHLSGDGRTLVVGAPLAVDVFGVGDEALGQVSIFRFDDDSDLWIQVAQFRVFGEQIYTCGSSVSMSSGGDVVAVGCPSSGVKGHYSGAVRVLREVPCEEEDVLTPDNLTPCRQRPGARV